MYNLDPRYGRADANSQSPAAYRRREGQNGLGSDNLTSKSRSSRDDDTIRLPAKTSVAEVLDPKSWSYSDATYGLFKPLSDSKSANTWGPPSALSSVGPLISPLDAANSGYNAGKTTSIRTPSPSSARNPGAQDQGNPAGWDAVTAWGNGPGVGNQTSASTPPRKPLAAPGSAGSQAPMGGATLPRPKIPGSVFN
jgi:hypothetical protein